MASAQTHEEFINSLRQGCRFHVDKVKAQDLLSTKLAARRYRHAHWFWSTVWLLSIAAALGFLLFGRRQLALGLVLIAVFMCNAIIRSATEFVLEQAIQDPKFYEVCLKAKAIVPAD